MAAASEVSQRRGWALLTHFHTQDSRGLRGAATRERRWGEGSEWSVERRLGGRCLECGERRLGQQKDTLHVSLW